MKIVSYVMLCYLLSMSVFFQSALYAQSIFPAPFDLPKSPNSASLGKYGEVPTSLVTGQVSLEVPLYDLVEGDIELPISLTYRNTGLKVREIPSWAGMGWDLQAGGIITASINGFPDMGPQGILTESAKQDFIACYNGQMTPNERIAYYQRVANGEVDSQHDIYSYNFLGRSGRFYIGFDGTCISIPKNSLRITYELVQGHPGVFTIVDEKGFTYKFENKEGTNATNYDALVHSNFYNQSAGVGYVLTKITSPKGNFLDFNYKTANIDYYEDKETYTKDFQWSPQECSILYPYEKAEIHIQMTVALLESIESPNVKVTFSSNTIRQDLVSAGISNNYPSLDGVIIENSAEKTIHDIKFLHEYFGTNKRLKLKKIQFLAPLSQAVEKEYQFKYYKETANFPSLNFDEYAIDHWGYYNGATSNQSLIIPSLVEEFTPHTSGMPDADRSARSTFAIQGMLQEIVYPTGGSTLFEYEANQFLFDSYESMPFVLRLDLQRNNPIEYETIFDRTARSGGPYEYGEDLSGTFTIAAGRNKFVKLDWGMGTNDPSGASSSHAEILTTGDGPTYITDIPPCEETYTTSQNPYNFYSNNSCVRDLTPGTYQATISALTMDPEMYLGYAYVRVSVPKQITNLLMEVGGLRLSKMTDKPNLNQPPIVKKYVYDGSRANLRIVPKYNYVFEREYLATITSCLACTDAVTIYGDDLIQKKGHHIEYAMVTEILGNEGENGKILHEFYTTPDIGGTGFPFTPTFSLDYLTGNLKSREYFKSPATPDARVMKESFTYEREAHENYNQFDQNLKVGRRKFLHCIACLEGICDQTQALYALGYMEAEFVPLYTEYYHLKRKEVITYVGTEEEAVTNVTQYFHDGANKALMSKEIFQNSTGSEITALYTYPQDVAYTGDPELARQKLLQDNRVDLLVGKTIMNGTKLVSRSTLTHKIVNGMALPATIEEQRGDSEASIKFNFYNYDEHGNVLEQGKEHDVRSVYLYGYNNKYPVAEIINADWHTVNNEFICTSFEADQSGEWVTTGTVLEDNSTPTGRKCLQLGSIQKINLNPATTYVLSYWSKATSSVNVSGGTSTEILTKAYPNGWSINTRKVTGAVSITIQGTGYIDEVRLYPLSARITTYTYDPLVGITSICDPNNIITYYEYDDFNRLITIRDSEENIVKTHTYHYTNSAVTEVPINYIQTTDVLKEGLTTQVQVNSALLGERLVTHDFFDGLGRLTQSVAMGSSPGQRDVVQPITYDEFGREAIKYLPYVPDENNGTFKANFIGTSAPEYASLSSPHYTFYQYAVKVAHDEKPYAKTVFEPSPLNRVIKQGAVGAAWQPGNSSLGDNTLKKQYETNGPNEVLHFTVDPQTFDVSASDGNAFIYYAPNQLYVNNTLDEHNNEVVEYVDKEGRTVCKKVQYKSQNGIKHYANTYYVYDDLGDLVAVLPPLALKELYGQ